MAGRYWSIDECGWVDDDALATPWSDRRMDAPDLPTMTGYPDVLGHPDMLGRTVAAPTVPTPRTDGHDTGHRDTDGHDTEHHDTDNHDVAPLTARVEVPAPA